MLSAQARFNATKSRVAFFTLSLLLLTFFSLITDAYASSNSAASQGGFFSSLWRSLALISPTPTVKPKISVSPKPPVNSLKKVAPTATPTPTSTPTPTPTMVPKKLVSPVPGNVLGTNVTTDEGGNVSLKGKISAAIGAFVSLAKTMVSDILYFGDKAHGFFINSAGNARLNNVEVAKDLDVKGRIHDSSNNSVEISDKLELSGRVVTNPNGNISVDDDLEVRGTTRNVGPVTSNTIEPMASDLYDLGASNNEWNRLFVRDSTLSGNLTVNGNTVLGDSSSDTVTFNARVNSNIIPATANAYDLGSSSLQWRTGYFGTSVVVGSTTTYADGTLTTSSATPTYSIGGANMATLNLGGTGITTINVGTTNSAAETIAIGNSALANTITLGSTTGAAATTVQSGTGNLALTSTASVNLSAGTPSLFTLATATNAFVFGSSVLGIDTTNSRVGIGTSAPSRALDLAAANAHLIFSSTSGPKQILTGGTTNLSLMPGGNVGIGMTNPASTLSVNGNGAFGALYSFFAAPANGLIAQGNVGIGTSTPRNALDTSGSVAFGSLPTTALPQANSAYFSGNVGIGVTNPSSFVLQVAGSVGPNSDNLYDLGSTSLRWRTVHVGPSSLISHNDATNTLTSTFGFTGNRASIITDAASPLWLSTGTNLGFFMNTSGNVGIGTTIPNANSRVTLQGGGTGSNLSLLTQDSGGTLRFAVTDSGNVGIGTTAPAQSLDLSVANANLTFSSTTGAKQIITGGTTALALMPGGNVGIGSTNANNFKLQIAGNVGPDANNTYNLGSSANNFLAAYLTNVYGGSSGAQGYWNRTGTYLTPITISDIIGTTGNVGVGTTNSVNKLDVSGGLALGTYSALNVAPTNGAIISGNVGIGTTNTTFKLQVSGNIGPDTNIAYNLGASGTSFLNAYLNNVYGGTSGAQGYLNRTGTYLTPVTANDNIATGGNVGIGTTNSVNKLDVNGGIAVGTYSSLNVAPTNGAIISGNVGIGTTNTTFKLQVGGNIGPDTNNAYNLGSAAVSFLNGYITNLYGGTSGAQGYWNRTGVYLTPVTANDNIATGGNVGIGTTNAVNKLNVSGGAVIGSGYTGIVAPTNGAVIQGNVGIGVTTPLDVLDVSGNALVRANLGVGTTAPAQAIDIQAAVANLTFSNAAGNHQITTGGSSNLALMPGGNVGIGTTAAFNKVDVSGAMAIGTFAGVNAAPSNGLIVSGSVGIGTTVPGTKFAVNGLTSSTGTAIVADATGNFYLQSSSRRFKDNIQDYTTDFTQILQAQPKSFNYKATGVRDVGYIAEEFDSLGLKDLVLYDNQGLPTAIKYDRVSLFQNEILKSQKTQLDTLAESVSFATESATIKKSLNVAGNLSFASSAKVSVVSASDNSRATLTLAGPSSLTDGANGGDLILSGGAAGAGGVRGAVVPSANGADNLGKSTSRWGSIFANTIDFLTSLTGTAGTPTVDLSTVSSATIGNNTSNVSLSGLNWNVSSGGAANFTSIGAVTPGTGAFTILSVSGLTNFNGGLTVGGLSLGSTGTFSQAATATAGNLATIGLGSNGTGVAQTDNLTGLKVDLSDNYTLNGKNNTGIELKLKAGNGTDTGILVSGETDYALDLNGAKINNAAIRLQKGVTLDNGSDGTLSLNVTTLQLAAGAIIQPATGALTVKSGDNLTLDSGATLSLGDSSASKISIGTGSGSKTITIGSASADVTISGKDWSVSSGNASFKNLTVTGSVDFSGATALRIPREAASDKTAATAPSASCDAGKVGSISLVSNSAGGVWLWACDQNGSAYSWIKIAGTP